MDPNKDLQEELTQIIENQCGIHLMSYFMIINDRDGDLFNYVKTITNFRKSSQDFQSGAQTQRYADDQFYAFTRGLVFVASTNQKSTINKLITFHPYKEGQKLCNIFNGSDCVTVQNKSFNVSLNNGEFKIYNPTNDKREFLEA